MSGKRKGRAFEREIYKLFRDSGKFKKVNLTLGSGSTDETSDINATDFKGDVLVFELKTGSNKYISEPNLNSWWDKLLSECSVTDKPYLIYKENYNPIMIMFELILNNNKVRVRTEFKDWFERCM